MYPYQGIFKGISDKEQVPRGKKTIEKAKEFTKSQVEIGQKGWKNEYESVTNHFYKPKPIDPQAGKNNAVANSSNFEIGQDRNFDRGTHYKTEAQQRFAAPVSTAEHKIPARDKTQLFGTNYSLGDDRRDFATTNKTLFNDKSRESTGPARVGYQRERYNIITNNDNSSHIKQNTNAFDHWNPEKSKSRTSNNLTDYPIPGRKVDIITGRVLPTSKNVEYR